MIIKTIDSKENNHAIEHLLDKHSERSSLPIPEHKSVPLSLAAYDGETYLGGISGDIVWNHLHIHLLAVNSELQQKGIGSALIAEAETIARAHACRLIIVETMSWQAPLFYQKNGFVVFGEVNGLPIAETDKLYLVKYLH